jgi:hypothetical protein
MPGAHSGRPGSGFSSGDVIHLGDRRRPSRTGPAMPIGGNAAYQPDDEPTDPAGGLAQTLEAMFLARARTLTDDDTGEAFDITLEAVQLMLDGALAQGHVSTDAHRILSGMVAGMRTARHLL